MPRNRTNTFLILRIILNFSYRIKRNKDRRGTEREKEAKNILGCPGALITQGNCSHDPKDERVFSVFVSFLEDHTIVSHVSLYPLFTSLG